MPSLQFYADSDDFLLIWQRLQADKEIACIFPNEGRKWIRRRARRWIVRRIPADMPDGMYILWHIPGGPLPLLSPNFDGEAIPIDDPFSGWTELRPGADPRVPFFGSIPQIIIFSVQRKSIKAEEGIGQSLFGWIGNRYRAIGQPAARETERWWRSLGRWFKSKAERKITPWGPLDGPNAGLWVFPSAYRQILLGKHRDVNPAL
jgi:hypothetical protein